MESGGEGSGRLAFQITVLCEIWVSFFRAPLPLRDAPPSPVAKVDMSTSTMPSKKAKGFTIVDAIQRGDLSVVEAFGQELSRVFAAEVLPKLDSFKDVLSLAQVNKACNAAVWNEHGVVSLQLKDKMKIKGYQMLPMLWSAHQGNLPAVKALIQAGEDVDEIGNHYRNSHAFSGPNLHVMEKTALAVAATSGHSKVVGFLIDEGANLHLRGGNEKRTALLCACDYGHVECARMLIEAGSNVDVRDHNMATPLILCSDNKKSAIPNMQLLLKHGANVNCASLQIDYYAGNTALHRASYHGMEQTVTALLEAGAQVDAKSLTGKTALCYAASQNRYHIVEELLNAGACVFPLVLAHSACLKELTKCKRELAELSDSSDSDL
jgi:ankyrin repeat protein